MTQDAPAERTALEDRLIALIRARGPITVADYMADALFHPQDGYYTARAPIGADGDFITAPEVSQIFGELIGLWLVQSWTDMGAPAAFNLVELGPGRGVLMQDVLRAARLRPAFLDAAHVFLVETGGRLRLEQRRRLKDSGVKIDWADRFADIAPAPTLLVANEFFDCLPVRQFVRVAAGWRERLVGIAPDGTGLAYTLGQTPPEPTLDLPSRDEAPEGAIYELNEAAEAAAEEIARALVAAGGRALIIDYGHLHDGFGETLQAVRRHAHWPVLSAPGAADITAHVNFERLTRVAFNAGASAQGPVAQGAFLERLGLPFRLERLSHGKTPAEVMSLHQGALRLVSPDQMGELFKAFCISAPGLPAPQGFQP